MSGQSPKNECSVYRGGQYPALVKAVEQGHILESEIDVVVRRLMLARMKLGMFDPDEMVPWSSLPLDEVAHETGLNTPDPS